MKNYKLILISVFIFAIILLTSLLYFGNIFQLKQLFSLLKNQNLSDQNLSALSMGGVSTDLGSKISQLQKEATIKALQSGLNTLIKTINKKEDDTVKEMSQSQRIATLMKAHEFLDNNDDVIYALEPTIKQLLDYPGKLIALQRKNKLISKTKKELQDFKDKTKSLTRSIENLQSKLEGFLNAKIILWEAEAAIQKAELGIITDALRINTLIRELTIAKDQLDNPESIYSGI